MGLNATWDLLDALTPIVPFFKRLAILVENSFDLRRSSKHTLPDGSADVLGLLRTYINGEIFRYHPERTEVTAKGKEVIDTFTAGVKAIVDTTYLENIFDERWVYIKHQSTQEDYSQSFRRSHPAGTNGARAGSQEDSAGLNVDEEEEELGVQGVEYPDLGQFDMDGFEEWPKEMRNSVELEVNGSNSSPDDMDVDN